MNSNTFDASSFQVIPCLSDFYSFIVKFRWWSSDKVILLDRWFLHHNIRSLTFQDLIPYSKTTMIRTLFTLALASIPSVTRSGWLRKFLFHYSLTKSLISFITGLSIQHSWRLAKCSLPCNYRNRKGQKLLLWLQMIWDAPRWALRAERSHLAMCWQAGSCGESWELCRLPEPLSPGSRARDGMRDGAQGWKYSHRIHHLVSCLMWTLPWLRRLWPEMTLWNLPQRQPRPQQSVCCAVAHWCCELSLPTTATTHQTRNFASCSDSKHTK